MVVRKRGYSLIFTPASTPEIIGSRVVIRPTGRTASSPLIATATNSSDHSGLHREEWSEDGNEDESSEEDGEDDEQASDAEVSRKARKAAKADANSIKPSRGAARKALLDGDDSKIAQLVASDRAKATRRAEKHHGKKAHAGKAGRAHAGGKAKTGKARMISDSMDF